MNNILTAEEFFEQNGTYPELAIKFAKLHVEKALKRAFEKANIVQKYEHLDSPDYSNYFRDGEYEYTICENSILDAYPLENIK